MTAKVERNYLIYLLSAVLTALLGVALWCTPMGESWVNASYDYLFRFGSRGITNQVVLVMMDNEAYDDYDQVREGTWDRALHAKLLNKLADDGCALVVFDTFFHKPGDAEKDAALAAAIRHQGRVVLMAKQSEIHRPDFAQAVPSLPADIFLTAAQTNFGVAWVNPDLDAIVRRHWPFPVPGPYPSLSWAAAMLVGARLDSAPHEQWLRYYGPNGSWTRMSYKFAMSQPAGYFHNQIVFVGREPRTLTPESEDDKFQIPYTRWTGDSVGGVEIVITTFLNLVNHDWLERFPFWLEGLGLVMIGGALGFCFCLWRRRTSVLAAVGVAVFVALGAVTWSYFTNHWFPWLIVSGGQVPCALTLALLQRRKVEAVVETKAKADEPVPAVAVPEQPGAAMEKLPDTPDYQLITPPFGHGAYGKVWLARNAVGQWQALKAVYLANFGENPGPFDREFNGITRYKPISDKHPGLLRVDFVSRKRDGQFYYVMELGDALDPGWETAPETYKPRDLASVRQRAPQKRLPLRECVRVGIAITEALDFLHREGLTHRDIKPQNVIFVKDHPKLADVGLIADIHPSDQPNTLVGTPGYMPPAPERPGTVQADIYSLGMLLYVIVTGRNVGQFPEIATSLAESQHGPEFFDLNTIILKACDPDCAQRYATAVEMRAALLKIEGK